MKILVIAYGYSGNDVSESYSAYQLVQALRSKHQVTVLTKDPVNEPNAIHVAVTPLLAGSRYYRALKLDYFAFMWKAYWLARKIVSDFDVVHHISPISLRYPNILCNLSKPFIWGPVGGAIPYPAGFRSVEKREPPLYRLKALDRLRLFVDPLMVNTLKRSSAIVVTSSAAKALLPKQYQEKAVVIPEAFDTSSSAQELSPPACRYIFSSGRLVPYKGMEFLIRAFGQRCLVDDVELWISGDGPEASHLAHLVQELKLEERVKLLGRVTRAQNYELMANALFCVFPALNEAFGHVNLEAMAAGKAVIVTDWGGPADIVEDGISGFKVAPSSPEKLVEELGDRMHQLVTDEPLRASMARAAIGRVCSLFSWDVVATKYGQLYRDVVGGRDGNDACHKPRVLPGALSR